MALLTFSSIKPYSLAFLLLLLSNTVLAKDWVYTVVEGDNLWNLSEQHLDKVTRFEQLRKLNNIDDPKHLKPGTRIRVPLNWIRSNPVAAKVASFNGTVELQRLDNNALITVDIGTLLNLGDQLRTAKNSTVAIEFADKSILTLHENSLVHFDHLSAHGVTGMVDSRLNLLQGRMDTKVTPAVGPGSRFEIQTPSAISAVRGTVYRASVANHGDASNIEVLEGKVAVSGADTQLMINKGFGTQVAVGEIPSPPRALLPAPTLSVIPSTVTQVNWRLSWSDIESASAYRIEVATDNQFDTLLWQEVSQYNRTAFPDLIDGHYAVRVRAIDDFGLEGFNQQGDVYLNAHPQPPIALNPVDQSVFRGQSPILQWTDSDEATRYRLEIATDEDFTQLVLDNENINDTKFDTAAFQQVSHYYWRLSSIAADGEIGPVGPIRSYQIKAIPEKVDAALAVESDGLLVASWNAGSTEQHYQIQVANDKTFKDIVIDQIVEEPQFAFEPIKETERYLRVKSIEDDGYEGPWAATQTIAPLPKEPTNYWPIIITTLFTIIAF
jgi:hypothetical protein